MKSNWTNLTRLALGMIFAYFYPQVTKWKKSLKTSRSWSSRNELVLAIRPLFVPDLDGRDKRPIPALVGGLFLLQRGDLSPFFIGLPEGMLARKIRNY
jgi:hypothetical protein